MSNSSRKTLVSKSFGIKNYRSIGEGGIYLDKVSKINLFIGKNNSGKSNILKFINTLASLKGDYNAFPSNIENQHQRNNKKAAIFFKIRLEELDFPELYPLEKFYSMDFRTKLADFLNVEYDFLDEKLIFDKNFESLPKEAFFVLSNKFNYPVRSSDGAQETKDYFRNLVRDNLLTFFKHVIYIPDFRFIKEGVSIAQTNTEINGSNIISEMFKMQNPIIGDENKRKNFYKIRDTVRGLLNISDLEIEIPHSKDQIYITLNGNRLPLDYFGTGIHELVILCSALIIHDSHIVCLEEPEIHLHPELQKKFFNFLLSTNNKYFITTHSNSFLDYLNNDNISIYHVSHNGVETKVCLCDTNKASHELINDLGYRASDLLQANGIIWVEGPSDRIFLKRWFALKNVNFIEGIHFSIMYYGGKVLSHFSADIEYLEEELIPLFRINKNAFVIIDSDITIAKSKLNKTKQRIQLEIGENNCWITKGKEIENYLSNQTIERWLLNKHGKDVQVKLIADALLPEILNNRAINIKYSNAKTTYAREIISFIEASDLNILDLDKKLNQLIKEIECWNK